MSADVIEVKCPHCECIFVTTEAELNCGIFRHGANGQEQAPPHASEEACNALKAKPDAKGCFMPVKVTKKDGQYVAEKADFKS